MSNEKNTILVVDKDDAVYERETLAWRQHGINTLRVETMSEAVKLLNQKGDFLFIAINEDTIPNFMSVLPIMRDSTSSPIFVITSSYTIEKKIKAMNCGADVYDPFNTCTKENVHGALTLLKAQNRRTERPPKPLQVQVGGGIILSPLRRSVFLNDVKVSLTKQEFDILYYLMDHDGHVVEHTWLIRKIGGNKSNTKNAENLWRAINRIRGKLSQISSTNEYIEIERGVGYRFTSVSWK